MIHSIYILTQFTDVTSTVPTTTIISPSNSTATTKLTHIPTETTTESSSEIGSTSDTNSSSSESSSSSQTSEETENETNETSSGTIASTTSTTTARTTRHTTTSAATPIATTSTPSTSTATSSIAITTTTPAPDVYIMCYDKDNKPYIHPVVKAKSTFAIKPISATSVKIVTSNLLSNMSVLCFSNATNFTMISEMQHQKHEYFAIINNLNSSQIYTFCLLQEIMENLKETYNWNISPFDCSSYSRPEILPQPWLETEDRSFCTDKTG